jgi:hypothetical protein
MLSKLLHKLGIAGAATTSSGESSALTVKDAEELLDAYAKEVVNSYGSRPKEYEAGRAMLELPREAQAVVAAAACQRVKKLVNDRARGASGNNVAYWEAHAAKSLASELLQKKLPFSESQIASILQALTVAKWIHWMPGASCMRAVEVYVESNGLSSKLSSSVNALIKRLMADSQGAEGKKLLNRLLLIRDGKSTGPKVQLTRTENWSAAVLDYVDKSTASLCDAWRRLLASAGTAVASKPSQKWLKEAKTLIDEISAAEFRTRLLDWIALVEQGGRLEHVRGTTEEIRDRHLLTDEPNARTLKGLVWCATQIESDDEIVHAIGRLGACCYRKIPGYGARSTAVANACVWALGAIPSREAVGQLSYLRSKSKYQAAQQGVAKALNAAAQREGMSTEDLEELAVPKLGLTDIGRRSETLGDYRAELVVEDTHTATLSWLNAKGKPQKSVPTDVKRDFAKELKELKSAQKELQKLLPSQRFRIESTYLRRRHWTYSAWRERFIDHPLVGTLARRLIWEFGDGKGASSAIWHDDALVDAGDSKVGNLSDDTRVALWHPVHATIDDIVAWRQWLERHEVSQPFKQAHREIYVLTEAERNTETYSNRFAAHVLRQHQFNALCSERGWQYRLQGAWDSANTPTIDLPRWEMRAEFWVESVEHDETTGAGIFNYVSSDQVRFYDLHEPGPQRLENVPPLVFTEIMRDVDLFVGVASVGNDPNWNDGGPNGQYQAYWHSVSFGDLSASAKTRREVLSRLIPRLKIADRATLDEKHLIIRGELRSYKIHLGSGNILMTPNDAYLCIVPGQGAAAKGAGKVYLPFEGDQLLSIILSKAILLADDTKITDRTITSQIRSR